MGVWNAGLKQGLKPAGATPGRRPQVREFHLREHEETGINHIIIRRIEIGGWRRWES